MRKALKKPGSTILTDRLTYSKNNAAGKTKIAAVLFQEQKGYCAYTDEMLSRTDAEDIEHFNPTIKYTAADGYDNWFLVKHQWNMEKASKWAAYQPVVHPAADDFEQRIVYDKGDYLAASAADAEANNLIRLLKLDDAALAEKRKQYIARKQEEMTVYQQAPADFFGCLVKADPCQVHYPRAVKETFGIDIWEMLP